MMVFPAMGTHVAVSAPELTAGEERHLARRVAAVFADCEGRFSRFSEESELSRLNQARGPVPVSAAMFDALRRARHWVALSGGLFDPTIGAALIAEGYDRSHSQGRLDRDRGSPPPPRRSFLDLQLDAATRTVNRPPGLVLDFGGFIKGYAVDRAAELLHGSGAIDAGGDCRLEGPGWEVEIEDPSDTAKTLLVLSVHDGAVATSAANRRRWKVGDEERHHLIDPRTRRSARSDLAQATVVAARAELADVLAKTAFLLGGSAGAGFLERQPGVSAILVGRDGRVTRVGDLEVLDG